MIHRDAKIVVKFGGSNLRRPDDVDRLVEVVRRYDRPLVLVVSAFYGITNELVACLAAARQGAGTASALAESRHYTDRLRALKKSLLDANIADVGVRARVMGAMEERLDQLDRYLTGVHYIGAVPEFVNDAVLSYGERLSSLLLTEVLRARGLEAREALPETIGLVTDGVFGNAACDFAASELPVAQALGGEGLVVVPGFYGIDAQGRTTLFGRGGSDYSAASIARCLGAASLDLWKDVDGFLSADPGTVGAAHAIPQLHYLEAAELSYFGAKILHPRTVEPLLDQAIPIRIHNITRKQDGLRPCTVINGERVVSPALVKSVASSDDVAILKVHGPGVGFQAGILARVTSALHDRGLNIKSVVTAQTAIHLLLARGDLEAAFRALQEHRVAGVVEVGRDDSVAIVAVVGDGVSAHGNQGATVAARALSAALDAGVRVALAAAGASEVATYLLVHRDDRQRAVRAIHQQFFTA